MKINYIDVNVEIGSNVQLERSELHGKVIIGNNSKIHQAKISGDVLIGKYTSLWGPNIQVLSGKHSISIGNFCSIARDVTIQEYFHDLSNVTTYFIGRNIFKKDIKNEIISKGPIVIGNDVWIGTGVQIMSGVKIGDGAVIAANSTVTKDIPPYAVVAGVPSKIIKYRFDERKIEELMAINWWDWGIEDIVKNEEFFTKQETY